MVIVTLGLTTRLTGCSSNNGYVTGDTEFRFIGVDAVTTEEYYSIRDKNSGRVLCVRTKDLAEAIPNTHDDFTIGFKVDENGNVITIPESDLEKSECDYISKNCKKYDDESIKLGTLDGAIEWYCSKYSIKTVAGYRIKKDGVTYDILKSDLIEEYNISDGCKLIIKSNPNGGFDEVTFRRASNGRVKMRSLGKTRIL